MIFIVLKFLKERLMSSFIIRHIEVILISLASILIYFIIPIGVDWHKYYQLWISHALNLEMRHDIPQFNFYNIFPLYLSKFMGYNDFRVLLSLCFLIILAYLLRYSAKSLSFCYLILVWLFYWGLDRQIISFVLLCIIINILNIKNFYIKSLLLFLISFIAIKIHTPSILGFIFICHIYVINEKKFIYKNFWNNQIHLIIIYFIIICFVIFNLDIINVQYLSQLENIQLNISISRGILIKIAIFFLLYCYFISSKNFYTIQIYFTLFFIFLFIIAQIFFPSLVRIEYYTYLLPIFYLITNIHKENIYTHCISIIFLVWILYKFYTWDFLIFNTPQFIINFLSFPFF